MVEIFTAQERIAVSRQDFKLHFAIDVCDFNNRYVERTTAQIVYSDFTIATFGFIQTERQCRSSWFVDDTFNFQASDTTRVFSCLTLRIIEVGWNSNNGFRYFFTEVVFGGFFHFAQDFCGDLWWRHFFVAHTDPCVAVVGFNDGVRHQADVFLNFFFVEFATDQTLNGV